MVRKRGGPSLAFNGENQGKEGAQQGIFQGRSGGELWDAIRLGAERVLQNHTRNADNARGGKDWLEGMYTLIENRKTRLSRRICSPMNKRSDTRTAASQEEYFCHIRVGKADTGVRGKRS